VRLGAPDRTVRVMFNFIQPLKAGRKKVKRDLPEHFQSSGGNRWKMRVRRGKEASRRRVMKKDEREGDKAKHKGQDE